VTLRFARLLRVSVLFKAVLTVTAGAAFAQSASRAAIMGRVVDGSDAVLQGAEIVITGHGETDGIVKTAKTSQQGEFALTGLTPGSYTLIVTYIGFKNYQREIDVTPGQAARMTVTLEVASQNEQVLVTRRGGSDQPHAHGRQHPPGAAVRSDHVAAERERGGRARPPAVSDARA
jgi:Carboxypeptidase regulatory-like domain